MVKQSFPRQNWSSSQASERKQLERNGRFLYGTNQIYIVKETEFIFSCFCEEEIETSIRKTSRVPVKKGGNLDYKSSRIFMLRVWVETIAKKDHVS